MRVPLYLKCMTFSQHLFFLVMFLIAVFYDICECIRKFNCLDVLVRACLRAWECGAKCLALLEALCHWKYWLSCLCHYIFVPLFYSRPSLSPHIYYIDHIAYIVSWVECIPPTRWTLCLICSYAMYIITPCSIVAGPGILWLLQHGKVLDTTASVPRKQMYSSVLVLICVRSRSLPHSSWQIMHKPWF